MIVILITATVIFISILCTYLFLRKIFISIFPKKRYIHIAKNKDINGSPISTFSLIGTYMVKQQNYLNDEAIIDIYDDKTIDYEEYSKIDENKNQWIRSKNIKQVKIKK